MMNTEHATRSAVATWISLKILTPCCLVRPRT